MRPLSIFLALCLLASPAALAAELPDDRIKQEIAQLEQMHRQAETLITENRFREAVRLYSDIILVEPDDEIAYANMGHAYLILGDYGRAREAFLNALHINPENEMAYIGMQKIVDPDGMTS